jgi:hypothetical protein
MVDTNTSPKLVKILVAEEIYRPDEGVHQTPGGRIQINYYLLVEIDIKVRFYDM